MHFYADDAVIYCCGSTLVLFSRFLCRIALKKKEALSIRGARVFIDQCMGKIKKEGGAKLIECRSDCWVVDWADLHQTFALITGPERGSERKQLAFDTPGTLQKLPSWISPSYWSAEDARLDVCSGLMWFPVWSLFKVLVQFGWSTFLNRWCV